MLIVITKERKIMQDCLVICYRVVRKQRLPPQPRSESNFPRPKKHHNSPTKLEAIQTLALQLSVDFSSSNNDRAIKEVSQFIKKN